MMYETRRVEIEAIRYDGTVACRERIEKLLGEPLTYVNAKVPYLVLPGDFENYLQKGDYLVKHHNDKWHWASKRAFENKYMPLIGDE